jgi:hypothetical protein
MNKYTYMHTKNEKTLNDSKGPMIADPYPIPKGPASVLS